MSPGNLYRYFPSKEALIAGIAERDRAEVAQSSRAPTSRTASSPCSRGWRSTTSPKPMTSRSCCAPRSWPRARRNPEIARISARLRCRRQEMARRPVPRRGRARRHSRRCRSRRRGHHADDHRRRHVVAARGRSRLRRRKPSFRVFMDITRHMLRAPAPVRRARHRGAVVDESQPHHRHRPRRRRRPVDRVRAPAAARQRRRATRRSAPAKPRQEAVPRRRRRDAASCRTAASSCSPAAPRPTARSPSPRAPAASLTELQGQARQRRSRRATSSPCCPTTRARRRWRRRSRWSIQRQDRARGQAQADRDRRHAASSTSSTWKRSSKPPKAALARGARPSASAASSRAPWDGVINDVRSRSARPRSRSRAASIAHDRRARSDAGGGRGVGAQARRPQGRRAPPRCGSSPARPSPARIRFVSKTASPTTRTYRVEVELPNADGAIPDGITAEVSVPLAPVAGDARCRARR